MWLRKVLWLFLFCLFVFLFMIMAVTSCQAEEQALKEAGAETIAYLTSVETEKHMEADKAKEAEAEDAVVEEKAEPIIKLYYDVPLDYELQDYIIRLCEEHHIDSAVVIAMIKRESGFLADAIGDGGNSLGLMQIQPYWHQARMDRLGCTDLLEPYQNVTVGVDLLAYLIDSYGGDVGKALTAYNQGYCSGYLSNYATVVLATSEYLKEGMIEVSYLPDAYDMWESHDAQQEQALSERPVCADCDQHIQDEEAYYINGEWICESCMDSYKREVQPE